MACIQVNNIIILLNGNPTSITFNKITFAHFNWAVYVTNWMLRFQNNHTIFRITTWVIQHYSFLANHEKNKPIKTGPIAIVNQAQGSR
ncbi:hypothetical protein CJ20_253 [Escherichia phage CJ20]|nr:hypothetical protein CJ20_253 [Escherichia phage CJ20]